MVQACNEHLEIKSLKAADNTLSSNFKTSEISTKKNGGVTQVWADAKRYLVQMQDMSLHLLSGSSESELSL